MRNRFMACKLSYCSRSSRITSSISMEIVKAFSGFLLRTKLRPYALLSALVSGGRTISAFFNEVPNCP